MFCHALGVALCATFSLLLLSEDRRLLSASAGADVVVVVVVCGRAGGDGVEMFFSSGDEI